MKLIKMRIVTSADFSHACQCLQMALGCLLIHKKTLVWIVAFNEGDADLIKDTLIEVGSKYAGTWRA